MAARKRVGIVDQDQMVTPSPDPAPAPAPKPPSAKKAAVQGAVAGAKGGPQSALISGAAAAAGAKSAGKKAKKAAKGGKSPAHRILVAELIACSVIIGLSPLTDKHKLDSPASFIKRITAVAFLFLILGLVSSAGQGAAKVASAFGGLVTLSLALSSRDIFAVVAQRFGANLNEGTAGPDGPEDGEGGPRSGAVPAGGISRPSPTGHGGT